MNLSWNTFEEVSHFGIAEFVTEVGLWPSLKEFPSIKSTVAFDDMQLCTASIRIDAVKIEVNGVGIETIPDGEFGGTMAFLPFNSNVFHQKMGKNSYFLRGHIFGRKLRLHYLHIDFE